LFSKITSLYHGASRASFAVLFLVFGVLWPFANDKRYCAFVETLTRWANNIARSRAYIILLIVVGLVLPHAVFIWLANVPGNRAALTFGIFWLLYEGQPLYHDIDAAPRWAPIYGPLPFLIIGLLMRIAGPTALVAVTSSLLANGLILALAWYA